MVGEKFRQLFNGLPVSIDCLFGRQHPRGAAALDHLVIIHPAGGRRHGHFRVSEQVHVRPKGATKKMEAVDVHGLIFKYMHAGASGFPPQFINEARKRIVIEFMVTGDVDYVLLKPLFQDPPQAPASQVDVAGKDDHVGPAFRKTEITEFDVQVG